MALLKPSRGFESFLGHHNTKCLLGATVDAADSKSAGKPCWCDPRRRHHYPIWRGGAKIRRAGERSRWEFRLRVAPEVRHPLRVKAPPPATIRLPKKCGPLV